jgi:serine/threonine-protein kinase
LGASRVTVLAANPMLAPTVAPIVPGPAGGAVTAPDSAAPSVTIAPGIAVADSGSGANGRATVAPASAPVRTSVALTAVHRPAAVGVDRESIELMPVQEAMPKPSPPTVQIAVAAGLLLLALALAFVGIGSPSHGGNLAPGSVTVAGQDPVSSGTVELDLAERIPIAGTVADVDRVSLAFKVGDLTIGTRTAAATSGPSGFDATVDASGLRYLAPGLVTGEVKLSGGGEDRGAHAFATTTAQSPFLSLPGAVGIGLALFVFAYAESLLRSMRRGRRQLTGTIGLTFIGALAGLAAVIIGWLAGAAEPLMPTVVVCALLGAGAGFAAAMAAIRVSQRRRYRVSNGAGWGGRDAIGPLPRVPRA